MPWVKRNFKLTIHTARYYMRVAEDYQKENRFSFSTLSELVQPNRDHHQPAWHPPVRDTVARVDVQRLAQERQAREKEAKLIRHLAIQLIDIGYKVLATKLHHENLPPHLAQDERSPEGATGPMGKSGVAGAGTKGFTCI